MKSAKKAMIKALAEEKGCTRFRAETELYAQKFMSIGIKVAAEMYEEGELNLAGTGERILAAKEAVEVIQRNNGESENTIFKRWMNYAENVQLQQCECEKCQLARAENPDNVFPLH